MICCKVKKLIVKGKIKCKVLKWFFYIRLKLVKKKLVYLKNFKSEILVIKFKISYNFLYVFGWV